MKKSVLLSLSFALLAQNCNCVLAQYAHQGSCARGATSAPSRPHFSSVNNHAGSGAGTINNLGSQPTSSPLSSLNSSFSLYGIIPQPRSVLIYNPSPSQPPVSAGSSCSYRSNTSAPLKPRCVQSYSQSGDLGAAGSFYETAVPATDAAAEAQINNVLAKDYAAWTGSTSKPLTLVNVGSLLVNSNVKGSQAAVLGCLAKAMFPGKGKDASAVSLSYSAIETMVSQDSFVSAYIPTMDMITTATNSNGTYNLYGSTGIPYLKVMTSQPNMLNSNRTGDWLTIQQGRINNCFYLASIESMVSLDPAFISKMITKNSNGTFTVVFPSKATQTVTVTDGIIAESNMTYDNGVWLAVMNLAEAVNLKNPAKGQTPLGPIQFGNTANALTLLTGVSYAYDWFASGTQTAQNVSWLNKVLTSAFAKKEPVDIASVGHALSVIGFNSTTNMVTLLNPWGYTGTYTPEGSAPANTVDMSAGQFTLSAAETMQYFNSVIAPSGLLKAAEVAVWPNQGLHEPSTILSADNLPLLIPSLPIIPEANAGALPSGYTVALQTDLLMPVTLVQGAQFTQPGVSLKLMQPGEVTLASHATGNHLASGNSYKVGGGTVLVLQDHDSQIELLSGNVRVAAGAAVFIIQIGKDAVICNLSDKHSGDVVVRIGDRRIALPMGFALVLTQSNRSSSTHGDNQTMDRFSDGLRLEQLTLVGKNGDVTAYQGKYSVGLVLHNCPQLKGLLDSSSPQDRRLAYKLIKSGAALATVSGHF